MASVNKVILVGNLGADPETRFMPNGDAVANIRLATTESWKDKASGEKKEITEWHRVVFYRKLAEIVGQYLKKGSAVYVEGRIRTRKWQDKEGQERYTTEIVLRQFRGELQLVGGRGGAGGAPDDGGYAERPASGGGASRGGYEGGGGGRSAPAPRGGGGWDSKKTDLDDEIPF